MQTDPTPHDWLNSDFLKKALQNELKTDSIFIDKYDVEPAVTKGDHFASSLHRVTVNFTFVNERNTEIRKTLSLIVKSLPVDEEMCRMVSEAGTFKREADVYLRTLPAMYKLEQELSGQEAKYFTSKCLYSKSDFLVFEDLRDSGYKMADRRKGLDMSHCCVALKHLARFHALSIVLLRKDKTAFSNFNEIFYKEERRHILEKHFEPCVNSLASIVAKWEGYQRFGEKLRKFAENATNKMLDVIKPSSNFISVLNHGDFWVNNILFRYSESTGLVEDAKFVDFQIARYSSPVLDLQYFMNTSPSTDVRSNHMEELLEIYLIELRGMLHSLGCGEIEVTFEELKKEFEERSFFGVITALTLLHLVLADPNEKIVPEDERNPGFSGNLFKQEFQKLLLLYENKHWI
ncbi:hypothetical protein C0J52_22768 [Blattella germanica]|nr:hypothetical protein C0J52_22768 [Blattella germanica]